MPQLSLSFDEQENQWERRHNAELARLQKQVEAIYNQAIREAAQMGITIDLQPDDLLDFDKYPITKERLENLLTDLHDRLQTAIVDGIDSQWSLANQKNNALCDFVFADRLQSMTLVQQRRYFRNNESARDVFKQRQQQGLNLSDRVWHYTDLYRHEIEMGLDVGIRAGLSAAEMAQDLKQYLQHPDKLFRRVRDEHGNLVLSQAARDFHPGQGVYRSSFMNARRLAVTETNIAYRTADHLRIQQMDFVVGIEVSMSGNHTCKGHKGVFIDICDELQGRYPKDFLFTGWHPHCRCHATTILKTREEFDADQQRIEQGLPPSDTSQNEVNNPPEGFSRWVEANQQRIARSAERGTLPYFLRDNGTVDADGTFRIKTQQPSEPAQPVVLTPLEIAQRRHAARTPEDVARLEAMRDEWRQRNEERRIEMNKSQRLLDAVNNHWHEVDVSALQALVDDTNGGIVMRKDTLARLQQARQTIIEEIKKQREQERLLESIIPDAHKWHQQFTLDELQKTYSGVVNTLSKWNGLSLEEFEKKLKYEIKWIESHKKYSTWEVAQAAYKERLNEVSYEIKWQPIKQQFADLSTFKSKSKVFTSAMDEYQQAFAKGDMQAAQAALDKAQDYKEKSEKKSQNSQKKTQDSLTDSNCDINDVLAHTPQPANPNKQYSETQPGDTIEAVTGIKDAKKQQLISEAVNGFSDEWDYEIRRVQCGKTVNSRYNHDMGEICKRAINLEEFIAQSPQWEGGPTYRGMSLSPLEYQNLIQQLHKGEGDMLGTSSWSISERNANAFAGSHIGEKSEAFGDIKNMPVVLISDKQARATSIAYLSQYPMEREVIASKMCRWKYVGESYNGRYYYIIVTPNTP